MAYWNEHSEGGHSQRWNSRSCWSMIFRPSFEICADVAGLIKTGRENVSAIELARRVEPATSVLISTHGCPFKKSWQLAGCKAN
jgi:hypothetical protein